MSNSRRYPYSYFISKGCMRSSHHFGKEVIDDWLQRQAVGTKSAILVVDDEEVVRTLFKDILEEMGHIVIAVETGLEALDLVKQQDFDLIFLDLKMPGIMVPSFFAKYEESNQDYR